MHVLCKHMGGVALSRDGGGGATAPSPPASYASVKYGIR